MSGAKAVAIQINSPGGSAVQSMLIYKRIRALAAEKDLKVYVFAEDVAASGGYLLACAGDEIYADPSSIVGSIGVITATFGVNELINQASACSAASTPRAKARTRSIRFSPRSRRTSSGSRRSSATCMQSFIDLVKARRGAKLEKADDQSVHRRVLVRQEGARVRPDRRPLRPSQQDARGLRRRRASQAGDAVDLVVSPQAERVCRERRFRASACLPAGLPPISSRRSKRARSGRVSDFSHAATPHLRRRRRGALPRRTLVSRRCSGASRPSCAPPRRRSSSASGRASCRWSSDPATGVYRPKRTAQARTRGINAPAIVIPFGSYGRARPGHPRLSLCPEIRGCPAQGRA